MWAYNETFYQIYPIGFCGAPTHNDGVTMHRILKIADWAGYLEELGIGSIILNPIFESDNHGYDTRDLTKIDCRLGTNEDFQTVCETLHSHNIKIMLDGVFNHVGRGFWAFQDVLEKKWDSPYKDWFYINFDGNSAYNDGFWYEGWVNNWKQYFHQFYVDDVLIIPSWEEVKPEDEDKMIIHIDPGTAFGTGMHETTQLCIRQIRKYVTENTKILDVGCGSGILGMLALKFGAKYSVGTDLDPCAIDATHENMEVNGISKDRYEVMIGNIIDDKEVQDKVGYECYDIVAANILADVLVALTPVVVNQIKKGGIYITSGIIDDKEETVVEAVKKAGLEVLDITYQGEWVCVTARKN